MDIKSMLFGVVFMMFFFILGWKVGSDGAEKRSRDTFVRVMKDLYFVLGKKDRRTLQSLMTKGMDSMSNEIKEFDQK